MQSRVETLADAAVQLRRLEAIAGAGAMLELDWRGLTRLVGSIRAAVEQAVEGRPDARLPASAPRGNGPGRQGGHIEGQIAVS